MIYTPMTKKAMKLAYQAHMGQVDKGGVPYVFHPLHLAEGMRTEESVTVALLHDVVEDTPITLADLAKEGFPHQVLEALEVLSLIHIWCGCFGPWAPAAGRSSVISNCPLPPDFSFPV